MKYGKYIAQVFSFNDIQQVQSFVTTDKISYIANWIEEQLANGNVHIDIQQPEIVKSPKKELDYPH